MRLDDIRIKLDRAKEHLDEFSAEIDRFAAQKPHPIHVVTEHGSNRVYDIVWLKAPPAKWSALVGDCVHNLRCVLDHVVWDLSGGTGNAPNHTEFPIFLDEPRYFETTRKGDPARGSGLWKIEGVTEQRRRAEIEGLQPFRGPEPARHPLWVLHELDRFDKHQSLHVVFGWVHKELWRRDIHATDAESLPPRWRQIGATQSPSYPAKTPGTKAKVKMRFDLAMSVTLPPESPWAEQNLDVMLGTLVDFIERRVVERFDALERPAIADAITERDRPRRWCETE